MINKIRGKPFEKNHIPWNKGKKGYMVGYWKGKHLPKKAKEKMSLFRKGKTYEEIMGKEKAKLTKEKTRRRMKGHIINKGLKHSKKTKKKMSLAKRKEKNSFYGKKHTKESRKKMSKNHADISGKNNPMFGKHQTESAKRKYKEWRKTFVLPRGNTKIELKIQDFLTTLQIEFLTHKYMNIKNSYQCDIFIPEQNGIPQKTIIECDGDFIHCNPEKYKENYIRFPTNKKCKNAKEVWKTDEARTKQLIEKGFRVIRLWEHEIKVMELNDFQEVLNEI